MGGVVNIILREDYDGAETRVRYGVTSDGASDELQIAHTVGSRWSSGSIVGTYEYNERSRLVASERDRANDADLRRFGGSDRRRIFSNPGNIVVFDAAAGGYVPTYAIPSGQNGEGLNPSDIHRGSGQSLQSPRGPERPAGANPTQRLSGAQSGLRRPRLDQRRCSLWPARVRGSVSRVSNDLYRDRSESLFCVSDRRDITHHRL